MKCDNIWCVYYESGLCSRERIRIGFLGMCDSCIFIDIPEDYLKTRREESLRKLDED